MIRSKRHVALSLSTKNLGPQLLEQHERQVRAESKQESVKAAQPAKPKESSSAMSSLSNLFVAAKEGLKKQTGKNKHVCTPSNDDSAALYCA